MMKILKSVLAPLAWGSSAIIDRPGYRTILTQFNAVTDEYRWCFKTGPREAPDTWKSGKFDSEAGKLTPPSGGSSGVKPAPSWRDQGVLREAMRTVEREIATSPAETSPRRLSISPAPAGGFIVGEQQHRHSMPFFANRYAGNLADCLNFIEAELTEESA